MSDGLGSIQREAAHPVVGEAAEDRTPHRRPDEKVRRRHLGHAAVLDLLPQVGDATRRGWAEAGRAPKLSDETCCDEGMRTAASVRLDEDPERALLLEVAELRPLTNLVPASLLEPR
jgi:hypothetical protein